MKSISKSARTLAAAALLGMAMGLPAAAVANPLDPRTIPADAKWVMHVDVAALARTEAWKLVEPKLKQDPNYVRGIGQVERIFQANLPADLHDITLFGPSFGESEAVIVIRGKTNEPRVTTLLSMNEAYTTATVGGQTVHGWIDKGKQLYGIFAGADRIVVGQSQARVAAAADLLGGKGEAIGGEILAPEGNPAGMLFYVAGDELARLAEGAARNPLLKQLQSARFTLSEGPGGLALKGMINTLDEASAQNLVKTIDGYKAMLTFAENDPNARLAADATVNLVAKADGKQVRIDWTIPMQSVADVLNQAKPGAK